VVVSFGVIFFFCTIFWQKQRATLFLRFKYLSIDINPTIILIFLIDCELNCLIV
jgi:hypothetical protein